MKAGAQRYAAELGLALIIPDTSPRGVNIPGEDAQIDAVLAQAADQRQRTASRSASLRKRRLGKDEQCPHAASASR